MAQGPRLYKGNPAQFRKRDLRGAAQRKERTFVLSSAYYTSQAVSHTRPMLPAPSRVYTAGLRSRQARLNRL